METRSHKRAEASTASAVSGPTKRSRTSSVPAATDYSICTRSRTAALPTPMDSTPEPSTPSASANRGRRGKTSSNNKKPDAADSSNSKRNKSKGSTNPDKGKGKESEVRHRDTGRNVGLNINSQDVDRSINHEDPVLEDFPDFPNLTSASTTLQGLLRKLGAGLDEFLPSSAVGSSAQSETLKKILSDLRADGEEGRQVEALTQLSDMLSIGTEDSLGSFSLDSFVPVLVRFLSYEGNPDIMLLAARALTHLVEVLPSACAAVVRYGAVSCFVARLLTIEYMDLAEQSLQALKKISQEQPVPCLRAGALMAVLSYLDFFPTGVQRVALSTAENMCKKLPSDASDFVMEAVPLLTNLLQYNDAKVIEHASICLTRIAEAFASSPEKLDELCSHGIVTQAATLISSSGSGGGQISLGTSTYTGLIRLLATCASSSSLGAKSLHLIGISGILKVLLLGPGPVSSMSNSPGLGRPPEQIFEIVNLANALLPPFPQGKVYFPASSNLVVGWSLSEKGHARSSDHQEDPNENIQKSSTREELLNEQPGLLQQFGMDLLPVLVQIHGSSVNGSVRQKCLLVIGKIMHFSSSEMIQSLINVTNISSFLAGVLAWKDPQVLVPVLQIAEILMDKLPDTFSRTFVREGFVHAVEALILTEDGSSSQLSSDKKINDSIPGSSPRSKRNRRRGVNCSSVANVVDESIISAPSKSSSLHSVETPIGNSCLRVTVSAHAKVFKDKYFPSDTEASGARVADDLVNLKNLCTRLNMGIDEQNRKSSGKSKATSSRLSNVYVDKEEQMVGVIADVLQELSREDGASTFEFMGSGVVSSLLNYFTCGNFSKPRISEGNLARLRPQAIRRYKSFVSLALPSNGEGNVVPMNILVQKLQNALSSLERFPLALAHTSGSQGGTTRVSSGLSALSHPVKLRLSRARGEKTLVDFSSNVILVDPLSSLTSIEDFLFPRIQQNLAGQEPSPSAVNSGSHTNPAGTGISLSTRSRSSCITGETTRKSALQEKSYNSSKAKGKAIVIPTQEVAKGPRTRSAAHRRAALDKDNQLKPVYGETSSEEDELDILPREINGGLIMGDDYITDDDDDYSEDDDIDDVLRNRTLPVSAPDVVHEIKLSDTAEDTPVPASTEGQSKQTGSSSSRGTSGRGLDSNELKSDDPFASRGSLSFAAAAMAGLASANNIGLSGVHSSRVNNPPKLIFTSGGRQLNGQMTIYQAIQSQFVLNMGDDNVPSDGNRLWSDIHTIMYQRADSQPEKSSKSSKANASSSSSPDHTSLLDSISRGSLPCDLDRSNPTYNILALLRLLEGLNQLAPRLRIEAATDSFSEGKVSNLDSINNTSGARVSPEDFINGKLTPKLAQQIQNTLALCTGSLPSWCYQLTKSCPFLFPFETRHQYFYSTAFGLSRALNRLQQQQGANGNGSMSERQVRAGRLQRQKVRVSRDRILDYAAKVMQMYSSNKAVLEVEYVGEVGTGLGPTLEFYTLLSHQLQKPELGMWRQSSPDTIHSSLGLFPRPWAPSADSGNGGHFSKVVEYFRLLGRVMGKALQDGRLLDLPLSAAFYKLVLGQELDLHDIVSFDAELGSALQEFRALVCRKEYLETVRRCSPEGLRFRGASIEDLCLDFSLPGYPEYILKPGEKNVDMNNLGDYVSLVVDATVGVGIMRQVEAFRSGFNQVFDISTLRIFSPSELDNLFCGRRELWKAESLADHIKFDHGYTSKSPAIIYLLEIMGEFNPDQQRAFCQFVTGAPRLPSGGLAVLNPKLTIVRKLSSSKSAHSSSGSSECADDDLPSVMTCANYLKLPPYSSKEIMYKKLLYAISEGQGYFDLS